MGIVSTYRLQFHKGFTFRDAAAIVPYLHDLGITHVYASPYLKAVAGSTHGYDVIDHSELNPEVGTVEDYRHFVTALAEHNMSHILDTVPNHMGVETNDNQWWNDVLAHGKDSKYGNYFDIDWTGISGRRELAGKVLLPVLGEPYGHALANGLLQLIRENGKPCIGYYGRRFPIDPASNIDEELNDLLEKQHYRLSCWRVAADEINYRRFFDITSLAALQMQRQEVFDAAHEFTFKLIAEGHVAGLRVDHPDGLLDPKEYFDRLQATFQTTCVQQSADGKPLFVSVEKILNGDEKLCEDWAVAGTSGYDFLCAVNDLFVDSANESEITDIYAKFVDDKTSYPDWVYRKKCDVLDTAMSSEIVSLTNRLDALAKMSPSSHDFTRRLLHDALREVIACFPVYRSYVSSRGISESDIKVLDRAVDQAAVRNPKSDAAVLHFIRDSVLLRYPAAESERARQLDFAERFQQLTAPVNAKGIEDSAFYVYNRLTSLNEVGGDPGRFGRSCESIHRYFSHRQARWPLSLSSLSTHDTKRSEDVRARINVLSEISLEWGEKLERWKALNAGISAKVHPNDQYLLYQTLLGAWPFSPMDAAARTEFTARIAAYMQKATREAKLRSSWTDPNKEYEAAIAHLIDDLIDPLKSKDFLADFLPFQKRVSRLGLLNSLSQTVLRLAAPGICDTYQGTELWDFSLVDPDNRRPVNYDHREAMFADLEQQAHQDMPAMTQQLIARMEDGRIKLWVCRQLLQLRRKRPDIFLSGHYEPIILCGEKSANLFSFARVLEEQCVIVVVPRLFASLGIKEGWAAVQWNDTRIALPQNCPDVDFENIFTGSRLRATKNREIHCSQILSEFPVAVLTTIRESAGKN